MGCLEITLTRMGASATTRDKIIAWRHILNFAAGGSYAAAEIVWPLVLAFLLPLPLKPLLRLRVRIHIPRALCALLLVVAVLGLEMV